MKKYNFQSFNNKQLYQTLRLPIFNKSIQIPFFHPIVTWNDSKYDWVYNPLRIKKKWIVAINNSNNERYLRQYDASGYITWSSKQIIINATNNHITVKEYDLLNNEKLIGIVKYTLVV